MELGLWVYKLCHVVRGRVSKQPRQKAFPVPTPATGTTDGNRHSLLVPLNALPYSRKSSVERSGFSTGVKCCCQKNLFNRNRRGTPSFTRYYRNQFSTESHNHNDKQCKSDPHQSKQTGIMSFMRLEMGPVDRFPAGGQTKRQGCG